MVCFAQQVLRKVAGNWTFEVVPDRVELGDQIAQTSKATGAVSEVEGDRLPCLDRRASAGVAARESALPLHP